MNAFFGVAGMLCQGFLYCAEAEEITTADPQARHSAGVRLCAQPFARQFQFKGKLVKG